MMELSLDQRVRSGEVVTICYFVILRLLRAQKQALRRIV